MGVSVSTLEATHQAHFEAAKKQERCWEGGGCDRGGRPFFCCFFFFPGCLDGLDNAMHLSLHG